MTQLTVSFRKQLKEVQDNFEDSELYPSTNEQIEVFCQRVKYLKTEKDLTLKSFIEIGAGTGKVIKAIEQLDIFSNYYVIEKSNVLLSSYPEHYRVIGVDYWNTTFIDKYFDLAYSNCPFSMFGPWIAKMLKELSHSTYIFFIAPERWSNNEEISEALRVRGGEVTVLGKFSFLESEDRKARGMVELVEIAPNNRSGYCKDDPFRRFFEENFKYPEPQVEEGLEEKIENTKLVTGANLVEILVPLYDERLTQLWSNYKAVCSLPHDFLKEFEIEKSDLMSSLKNKLANTKKNYWDRLFQGMRNINRTLTTESQKEITGMMNAQAGIDFNRENAYVLIQWIIKNANSFYDKQLVQVYKKMLEYANVENYVSNKRVFSQNQFRYSWYKEEENEVTHVKLKVGHRIVLERCGGLSNSPYSWEKGLTESAANFIRDLLVIANNLGFEYIGNPPTKGAWETSEQVEYLYKDEEDGVVTLLAVRAFKNSNLHIKANPKFINALNCAAGRLLFWLGSEEEASKEVGIDLEIAQKFFNHSFRLGENQLLLA